MAYHLDTKLEGHQSLGAKQRLRRRLLSHAAELQGERQAVRELLRVDRLRDIEEASAVLEIRNRLVRETDEALRLVDAGRYGNCQECGEPIPSARLRALPFARRCRDCQEAEGAAS